MQTTIIQTKNKFLRKYINYFLFIKNEDPNYNKKHVFYPNTNNCLGLYKGSRIEPITELEYSIEKANTFHSYVTGLYGKPVTFHMSNVFDEVCIDFEPLGLEALTGYKISPFAFLDSVIENVFANDWKNIYYAAFEHPDPEVRASRLEDFFLKNSQSETSFKYVPFNQFQVESVDQLTSTFNLSYRSIHRLYSDQLGLSPKEFLKIARLRKSMNSLREFRKLSQLAYEIGYSDQSHLIREFKKLTGYTPKRFLKASSIIDYDVWWSIK